MLDVDDILPSPLTPLVLPPPIPEPVCEMQTPALFTMAQSSPQSQSVDTLMYARVNPLPSPATSSSSSGELRLYIDSDGNSPSQMSGPISSSQELILTGSQPAPPTSSITPPNPVTVPHSSQSQLPSWADEVEQSGESTPETVVPNWAVSGRIRGTQPRSQSLVYPPPVFPTPPQSRPPISQPRYGPTIPPLMPVQQPIVQSPYDRPTSTDNYPCTDPSPKRRTRAIRHETYPARSPQVSQSPAHTGQSSSRGPQPSPSRALTNPFAPTQGIPHRNKGPDFRYHEFTNPLGINTRQGIHVAERINYTSTPPQHNLKPTASSCSLGELENEHIEEGRDQNLPLECAHFPLNPRFTERFWHQSRYFFALADRANDYLNTFFSRDTAPYKLYAKYDPFYLQFGFLYPTQMDVNNTNHKVNRVKMLHTMHNYLFVQHHFQHTNPLIHHNSRLQYANTKLTSPYYLNYSYIIQPEFCDGTLRNFDPIKNYFLFSPLYGKTNRPILVPIEYLRCVEGGATKVTHGHPFNLLYRDWMCHRLQQHTPSDEETRILNHLLAIQPHCHSDLFPKVLAAFLAQDSGFLHFFRDPDNAGPEFEFEYRQQ